MTDLILEFYSEEIPAGMQAPAAADLQKKVAEKKDFEMKNFRIL